MSVQLVPEAGVRVRVPAKINLALCVGPRRADGFHPLATVYQAVSLFDEVRATAADPGEFSVTVTGELADQVPVDDSNLAIQAARLLAAAVGHPAGGRTASARTASGRPGIGRLGRDRLGIGSTRRARSAGSEFGVALEITKTIPVAGGLAGGSADGAAALVACAALWGLDIPFQRLLELAAELGSDVPFSLLGGTALGSGRGERVAPVLGHGSYHWVLGFGHGGMSTPAVYQAYDQDRPNPPTPVVPAELMAALRAGDATRLGRSLVNDLQEPALRLRPQLRRTLEAGRDLGALGAVVSGSGPTCAFLAKSEEAAIDLCVALAGEDVVRTARRVTAPVHGARLRTRD